LGVNLPKTDIPPDWKQIDLTRVKGTLLVVGAPDVGKSTFSRHIFQSVHAGAGRVAYLDGDPGQGSLGPPTTMTLSLGELGNDDFPTSSRVFRVFVGAVSPTGHMLQVLVGAARLVQAAYENGAQVVIYDTTGLIDPAQGGAHLKQSKIDLLRPSALFAIQLRQELEYLLRPLRLSSRTHVVELRPSPAVQWRDPPARRAYRAERFVRYFANAHAISLNWGQMAVFPAPHFSLNRLVALEDGEGFTLGLGIVSNFERKTRQVTLLTPLEPLDNIDAIHVGDVEVDPQTFEDRPIFS
jgi:polynucleotide 5'-hydroxyl-kinase GRC3/NOL9